MYFYNAALSMIGQLEEAETFPETLEETKCLILFSYVIQLARVQFIPVLVYMFIFVIYLNFRAFFEKQLSSDSARRLSSVERPNCQYHC